MEKDTGGPAFPAMTYEPGAGADYREGMTLRDYFAAQAIAILIQTTTLDPASLAAWAYAYADAMLAERHK